MSVVPGVLDALVARFRAPEAAALVGLQIYDGPETTAPNAEFLAVGLSPEDLTTPATRTPAGIESTTEGAEITCLIQAWNGGVEFGTLRTRAYAIFDGVVAEVERDPRLGNACSHAAVAGSIYSPVLVPDVGAVVNVLFTIRVRQF